MAKTRKERTAELLKIVKRQPSITLQSFMFFILMGTLAFSILKVIQMLYTTGIIVK